MCIRDSIRKTRFGPKKWCSGCSPAQSSQKQRLWLQCGALSSNARGAGSSDAAVGDAGRRGPKVVHLIRHGESEYNRHYAETGDDPMIFDAPLTPRDAANAELGLWITPDCWTRYSNRFAAS